jgi:hypothetical protein
MLSQAALTVGALRCIALERADLTPQARVAAHRLLIGIAVAAEFLAVPEQATWQPSATAR